MQLLTHLVTLALISTLGLPAGSSATSEPMAANAAGSNYTFTARGPTSLALGAEGKIRVSVEPTGDWHMNDEFPSSLSVSSSGGLTVAKGKLKKADASRADSSGLVFEVPIKAVTAGVQTIDGTLKFAVCRDEACAPSKETIAIKVKVEG